MTSTDHIALWDRCRQIIRDNIPAEQFDVWFKDITSVSFTDGNLTLMVPSSFFVEQLEERYMKILGPAIYKVYGDDTVLYYQYFPAKGAPVTQASDKPSQMIIDSGIKAQEANPFRPVTIADIDSQLNARYTFGNYCEGESNRIAVSIAKSIADNPKNITFNPFFLFGPTGVGKTHLIQAIGIRIKENNPERRVLYVTARLFESQYTTAVAQKKLNSFYHFYQSIDTLIIDDVQDFGGNKPGTQNIFFHIFNQLHQNNRQIIMSSDCAPSEMEGFEQRLLSRFRWGMSVAIDKPDLELRRRVLQHKAAHNGLEIPEDVIEYIAANVTDSLRELEGIVVSLITYATITNSEINIALAEQVIARAVKVSRKPVNFEVIADAVCSHYGIDPDLLFTKTRKREVSDARQVVMYLAKKIAKMPLVAIGHRLDRTHATVNYACNAIEDRLPLDRQLQQDLSAIQAAIVG